MGRKILFVTTDQQRYDTLGCNGGTLARTPVVDGLAAEGYRYERAHPQSVVCMPSRSTIITGQHPSTHGVWMNGVPLPVDAPSVAAVLHDAGYRTALIGKPHFEPFLDPFARFTENRFARARAHRNCTAASSTSSPRPTARSGRCTTPGGWPPTTPRPSGCSIQCSTALGGQRARRRRHRRAAGARQRRPARVVPHRLGRRPHDRLARLAGRRRRLVLLDELPRPAPPVGSAAVRGRPHRLARSCRSPPATSRTRPTRGGPRRQAAPLAGVVRRTPRLQLRGARELGAGDADRRPGPRGQRPQRGRVRADRRGARAGAGRDRRTRVGRRRRRHLHHRPRRAAGRLRPAVQGPVPRRRADAPAADLAAGAVCRQLPPATISRPVGLVDLAPTFCTIAGLPAPEWMQGAALPVDDADADRTRVRARA